MYNLTSRHSEFLPHLRSDISLSLGIGQCLILVGENGIGKSSLLRRIANDYSSIISLSMVEQRSIDIFYDRTLTRLQKTLMPVSSDVLDQKKFLQLWELFGFQNKGNHLLSSLSGGEGQLLKLICGLSVKANLFLLDEPTQYLDLQNQIKLKDVVNSMLSDKKSFLIAEHDLKWLSGHHSVHELVSIDSTLQVGRTWTT